MNRKRALVRALFLVALSLTAESATAHKITWQSTGGTGLDVGVGGGRAWLVANDGKIYRWHEPVTSWVLIPGLSGGVRIDVDGAGNALVVTRDNKLHKYNGSAWQGIPGDVRDIGVNPRGSEMWIIGGGGHADGNFDIYRWAGAAGWTKVPGAAIRIDVDSNGTPWVVNAQQGIYRWHGSGWQHLPGAAKDVGIGADGTVWAVGRDGTPTWWNGRDWVLREGVLASISVDHWGRPWGVNAAGHAYRAHRPGKAIVRKDLATGRASLYFAKRQGTDVSPVYNLAPGGSTYYKADTPFSTFWDIRADGTVRPAEDTNYCLWLGDMPPGAGEAAVQVRSCNDAGSKGWSFAADGTFRNTRFPGGCLDATGVGNVSIGYAKTCRPGGTSHDSKRPHEFVLE